MNILCENDVYRCEFCERNILSFFANCGCMADLEDRRKKAKESRENRVKYGKFTNNKKFHFDKQDLAKEIPATIASLERAGRLKTPRAIAAAKKKLEECKDSPVIDYQVHGHPSYDAKDFKHPTVKADIIE